MLMASLNILVNNSCDNSCDSPNVVIVTAQLTVAQLQLSPAQLSWSGSWAQQSAVDSQLRVYNSSAEPETFAELWQKLR